MVRTRRKTRRLSLDEMDGILMLTEDDALDHVRKLSVTQRRGVVRAFLNEARRLGYAEDLVTESTGHLLAFLAFWSAGQGVI